jgi:hypothetical protein
MLRLVGPAAVLVVVTGCGGSASAPVPTAAATSVPTATTAPVDPCAATTAPAWQPSLILCLSGAVQGQALVPDRDTTTCTAAAPGALTGTWVTLVNSIETRLEVDASGVAGSVDLDNTTADVTISIVQAAQNRSWSSLAETGRRGTVTIAADRSGTLDVTLPQRDLASGAEVPGTPPLHVRGTFRCPPG